MANERLVSAEQVYEIARLHHKDFAQSLADLTSLREVLEDCDTVDAVPVVHGRWIYHECVSSHDGAISGYSCSECNSFVNEEIFDMDEFHKDFCGHCGATVDGGNEDG